MSKTCRITQATIETSVPFSTTCPSSSLSFPIAVHVGEVTPFRTSAAGALRGKGILSLVLHKSLQCSQLLGPETFRSRQWHYCREQSGLPKKVCQKKKTQTQNLTEHLGCLLEASPSVLAGSGSVAHADLLTMGASGPIPLSGFPGAPTAWS